MAALSQHCRGSLETGTFVLETNKHRETCPEKFRNSVHVCVNVSVVVRWNIFFHFFSLQDYLAEWSTFDNEMHRYGRLGFGAR